MKVLAIGLGEPVTPEVRTKYMPHEVPATLQLYLDGKIDQFWFHLDPAKPGVVFLMNAASVDEAKSIVDTLPLAKDGLLRFTYMPVGPLMPLRMLLPGK